MRSFLVKPKKFSTSRDSTHKTLTWSWSIEVQLRQGQCKLSWWLRIMFWRVAVIYLRKLLSKFTGDCVFIDATLRYQTFARVRASREIPWQEIKFKTCRYGNLRKKKSRNMWAGLLWRCHEIRESMTMQAWRIWPQYWTRFLPQDGISSGRR